MSVKIKTRLLGAFLNLGIMGGIVGGLGIYSLLVMKNQLTQLHEENLVPIIEISEAKANVLVYNFVLMLHSTSGDQNEMRQYEKEMTSYETLFLDRIENYKLATAKAEEDEIISSIKDIWNSYRWEADTITALSRSGRKEETQNYYKTQVVPRVMSLDEKLSTLIALNEEAGEEAYRMSDAVYLRTRLILIGIVALIFIASIVSAIWIGVFTISNPLLKISGTLKSGSEQLSSASGQLARSSQEIANGASEQASSIEETTSSMEELASMVRQNLQNAKEASSLADRTAASSSEGYNQMEGMLLSMREINKASDQISKVIKIIDDIAFQTNILALNAAVEAARAGEAGMGFAVVADEVKNLANKSAEAAKETSEMIEASIKKTEDGVSLATSLAKVFQDILNNVQKVAEMTKEVEAASAQQDTGINQVNKAIIQFDEVVQSNAATAEETAGAAEELQEQVESGEEMVRELINLVNGTKLKMKVVKGAPQKNQELTPRRIEENPKRKTKVLTQTSREKEIAPEKLIPFEEDEEFTETD